ncbi:molybdate ABC transporter ATPase [Hyphomicrobium nitrativorans NL23]|uniref:Molybdate ABC transporter ATPase n=1 Tax=Hyphomicrobium nitrativorans NL23 TaxID=1029756 RepID=V5SAE4_9HYPH|nr:molybdenum ABC transporter ATP-binding protein [Hyphomicrobium nitrativorans]AHB47195.1 molybdate ABC transporter ATPase [Hyphomicrobium nitrativorans NL23]
MIEVSCGLVRPRFVLDASFKAPNGCVALFGPSGSGKTTIVRLLAGLERPERGRIVVGGRTLVDTEARIDVPIHKRRVGLVFQDGQLLPHLSVQQNLDYGRSFAPRDAGIAPFDAVVDLLGIGHLLKARPATLSGGERQRVSIGRALLAAPRLLVMDEPLASLDTARKLEILPFVERLRDELALPIVYVSHAVEEVARLATTVVRLSEGRVVAEGSPGDVIGASVRDAGDASFPTLSFVSAKVVRERPEFSVVILSHPAGEIVLPGSTLRQGDLVRVAIAATNVALAVEEPRGISVRTRLRGRILRVEEGPGPSVHVVVELTGGDRIVASLTRLAVADLDIAEGRDVFALVKAVTIDENAVATFRRDRNAG